MKNNHFLAVFFIISTMSLNITSCNIVDNNKKNLNNFSLIINEVDIGQIINGKLEFDIPEGEYSIYFGDENGNILEAYTPLVSIASIQEIELLNVVIPTKAKTLVLSDGDTYNEYISLPNECLFKEEQLYTFGALSDVHFNRYNASEKVAGDDAITSFDLALDYLEAFNVNHVAIAGDLSVSGEESAFIKYQAAIADRDYEVFSCTGNHDVNAIDSGIWVKYVNSDIKTNPKVTDIADNGLDFVYLLEDENGVTDVFVFLSQVTDKYNEEDRLLEDKQLSWLDSIAKKYKDKTIYLFFHTFLCGPDGQMHTGVGNLKNPGGYYYPLPYTYGNDDEVRFRKILKENKNIIHFSGHSHWMFEMEKYNSITNFSNYDGEYGYMVHVPSVTEPRTINDYDTDRTGMNAKNSQGWIISVYEDYIHFLPMDFINEVIYTQYIEIIYR